ncbi:unnamed protein product, partial [Heligmosomoides polygyrus]|uniref:Reverse transcriptase domain-containing protein n=1 Tax=Heligmosomoides polygyrus TaxID=6339 RepID=A0A183GLQ0_HELPZ
MKIFKRILDRRIREIVKLSNNQCGSVSGCRTLDAEHAARLLVEKHCEEQKPVHIAFLDLEAFDRVPREVIWYALRQHNVSEDLIEWARMLYSCPCSRVQAAVGTSMEFPISVGVHQKACPWTLLYADDVMLACEDKDDLERQVQAWCDRLAMFELKLNAKKIEAVVRPVAVYGAECWPATKEVETRLSVMETKMLRWTAGVTRMDRIRNDAIRQKFGVAPIADKMREARLR